MCLFIRCGSVINWLLGWQEFHGSSECPVKWVWDKMKYSKLNGWYWQSPYKWDWHVQETTIFTGSGWFWQVLRIGSCRWYILGDDILLLLTHPIFAGKANLWKDLALLQQSGDNWFVYVIWGWVKTYYYHILGKNHPLTSYYFKCT